jgi:hypothetical protein
MVLRVYKDGKIDMQPIGSKSEEYDKNVKAITVVHIFTYPSGQLACKVTKDRQGNQRTILL